MKKLILQNTGYQYLETAFGEWLDILGYNDGTVYNMPHIAREFLVFLENHGCNRIEQLEQGHFEGYYKHICSRSNDRRGGGLSSNSINKHIQGLTKFLEFLNHKGVKNLPSLGIRHLRVDSTKVNVLSVEAIQKLYEATRINTEALPCSDPRQEAYAARDRALLSIFYGCGLRRTEGAYLAIQDLNFDTQVLHVRKGKNYQQRLVPFNKANAQILQEYIYDHRPVLVKGSDALFINYAGSRIGGGSLYVRLKMLLQKISMETEGVGLHTLRHSIATHLLQAGMPLEKISRFLGHRSLESTQIYTHLAHEYV